jgi:aryl-phospho-beta-D-glucosidase BglC (GH1 family)
VTGLDIAMPLSTNGRFIVDAHGRRIRLAGVNWYGFHEDLGVAPGLDRTDRRALARRIAGLGFNSVRLPFSLWMTEQTVPVADQYLAANPDLAGATPMEVYDACVQALTGEGLIVIPNCHILDPGWCCADDDENGLWYNRRWPASTFFAAWQGIAARYQANPLVAAMDIMNEPRRTTVGWRVLSPTWGTRPKTDIAAMYTAVGNLIHQISPHVLIICEGLGYAADLTGVAGHPVRLERPGQVVYSVHDYSWFHPAGQPRQAYLEQMRRNGGYLLSEQIAPLWIGEFGNDARSLASFGRAPSAPGGHAASAVWWGNFEAWVTENDVDWCWWALNPTQPKGTIPVAQRHRSNWGDPETWGLLTPDWRGVANPGVLDLLRSMIPPRTGPGIT